MVVGIRIAGVNYLVFFVRSNIYGIKFFGCAICLVSVIATKKYCFSKFIYHIPEGGHQANFFLKQNILSNLRFTSC